MSSDHSPMLIKMVPDSNTVKRAHPFRYANHWSMKPGYEDNIIDALKIVRTGPAMYRLVCALKDIKKNLKAGVNHVGAS